MTATGPLPTDLDRALGDARKGADGANRLILAIPYARTLGLSLDWHGDEVTLKMPFHDGLVGNYLLPAIHGGAIAALMELAATVQLAIELECQRMPKPVNVTVDYFRTGHPQDTFARAKIMKPGRRVANVRVEAWQNERARPIAALHGHFIVGPSPTSTASASPSSSAAGGRG